MFARISIALVLSLAATVALAQGRPLEPIPVPQISHEADAAWKDFVNKCFVQANKRRGLGLDVVPQFRDFDGHPFDGLPPVNTAALCHVDGSKEVNARK